MVEWKERLWDIVLALHQPGTHWAPWLHLLDRFAYSKIKVQKKIELFQEVGTYLSSVYLGAYQLGDAFPCCRMVKSELILTAVLILIGKFTRYAALAYGTSLFL